VESVNDYVEEDDARRVGGRGVRRARGRARRMGEALIASRARGGIAREERRARGCGRCACEVDDSVCVCSRD